MTFKEYLDRRLTRADAKGDFIRLAKADSAIAEAHTWPEIKSHLEAKGLSPAMLAAGYQVWVEYHLFTERYPAAQGGTRTGTPN